MPTLTPNIRGVIGVSGVPVFNVMDPAYGALGTGVDDTAAINAAITAYNAAGGGVLYFPKPPSVYKTNGGHAINAPGIITGQGYGTIAAGTNGTSILSLANGANASMFSLAAKTITIQDLGLYGNIGNQTATSHGIITSVATACNYFRFMRVWIDSFHDDGIFLQGPGTSLEGMAHGLKLTNNGAHGVNLSAGSASDCHFTDCVMSQNVLSGALVNASSAAFTSCHMWGNGTSTSPPTANDVGGIFMPSGAGGGLRVTGGYYESNGNATAGGRGLTPRGQGNMITGANIFNNRDKGIYAFSNTNLVVSGCVVRNNALNGGSGFNGGGIVFDTCTACSAVSNMMFDSAGTKTQTYGYAENANTCNACLFDGNMSRAADHKTGSWLVGTGNPTATVVGSNVA